MFDESIEVGVGKVSLWGCWDVDDYRLADDIDVRALVLRDGCGGCSGCLLVADLTSLRPGSCLLLRRLVAEALDIAPENIGIMTTQNHSAPLDDGKALDMSALGEALVKAASSAAAAMTKASVAFVAVEPESPLVFCRRVAMGASGNKTKFTFWNGYRIGPGGEMECGHLMARALDRLAQGRPYQYRAPNGPGSLPGEEELVPHSPLPVSPSMALCPADDQLIQGIFFRNAAGEPIASLLRCPAHPDTANVRGSDLLSGDYPAYLRRRCEELFGGMSVFMTGPCGDQTSRRTGKSLELAEQYGNSVADAALKALESASWHDECSLGVTTTELKLRIRDDYPALREKAAAEMTELEADIKNLAGPDCDVLEIKRLSDQWERRMYSASGMHERWTGVDLSGRAGEYMELPLFILRIADAAIVALPGEAFGAYSRRLRAETLGDNLIVSEEGNGYLGYLCSQADYDTGGYGANAMIFDRNTEDDICDTVKKALADKTLWGEGI